MCDAITMGQTRKTIAALFMPFRCESMTSTVPLMIDIDMGDYRRDD
jgi:hypothetical protein